MSQTEMLENEWWFIWTSSLFFLFIENLFPNLTMELYFLMQLLTSRSIDMELIAVCGEGKKH